MTTMRRDAARREGDQPWELERTERLQPGEDPESEFVADAAHWYSVYSALLEAAITSDLPRKAAWFSGRRDFWSRRWKDLRKRRA